MVDPLMPAAPSPPRFDDELQAWVLSRYADVVAGFRHPHLRAATPDGEAHPKLRPSILAACPECSLPKGTVVDLIHDVAAPWSLTFAAAVTGLPIEAAAELSPYARQLFDAAANPFDPALQLRGQSATIELSRIFIGERGALDLQAFVALSQTLPCFLVNSWLTLLRHPSQLMYLHDNPDRMPAAIEELLRYAGPSSAQFRTATADLSIDGVRITTGSTVILMIASANRDAEQFTEPNILDTNRPGIRHLAFGYGAHACIGGALVRTAALSAMTAFVARFHGAEVLKWSASQRFAIRSLDALIVNG